MGDGGSSWSAAGQPIPDSSPGHVADRRPGVSPTCSSPSLATSPAAACRTCSDQTGVAVEWLCARSRHYRRPATSTASLADGRLARQLGLAGSMAVVTHCGSVVSSGQATGLAAASWRPMYSQSAAYTELPAAGRCTPTRPQLRVLRRGAQP